MEKLYKNREFMEKNAHLTSEELANEYGGHQATWRRWRVRLGISPTYRPTEPTYEEPMPEEVDIEQVVMTERKIARLSNEVNSLKRKNRELMRHADAYESIIELASEKIRGFVPVKIPKCAITPNKTVTAAVQMLSDEHGDEVVSLEVTDGLNQYDWNIFKRRAAQLVDTNLSIAFDHHSGETIEDLFVFKLGDAFSNDIHPELAKTNSRVFMDALFDIAEVESRMLMELAQWYPRVHVVSVPGNHPRLSKKIEYKLPQNNGDYALSKVMELMCQRQENIEFKIPKAWTTRVEIMGYTFLLNHGAGIKGSNGIPFYGFVRADGKLTAINAQRDVRIDYICQGHFHQQASLPRIAGAGKYLTNGTMKGTDEFAFEGLKTAGPAEQMFFGVNEKFGRTWSYDMRLDLADHEPSRYDDF